MQGLQRRAMQTATPHRVLSAAAAVDLATREAARLGMRLLTTMLGAAHGQTVGSQLVDGARRLAFGLGKGSGAQALASAHFEALERYFTSARSNRRFATEAAV